MKVYLFLPFLRTISGVQIGDFNFKSVDDFQKETKEIKEELLRICSFFRQAEGRQLDAFNYLLIEDTKSSIDKTLLQVRKDIEIFRYLTVDPKGKGLKAEHSTIYVIFPDPKNPWKFNLEGKNEEHFMYKITENFNGKERFATFPHASKRPPFIKEIYGDSIPHFDDKLAKKLYTGVSETDLRAMSWYNKTFLTSASDQQENLLRLSVAFECFFQLDEEPGRKEVLSELLAILKDKIKTDDFNQLSTAIKPLLVSRIIRRLSEKVKCETESEAIKKWFSKHFYSVGSGIRHGDEVAELPKPVVSKSKLGMSLWYAGDASHEYLNNVYFGQRLFKFLFEERYFPYQKYIRQLQVTYLEELLVSDEERLKILEKAVQNKSVGKLTHEDLRIVLSLGGTYFGDRTRIMTILNRILEELKTNTSRWKEISVNGEMILKANLKESDFSDYEKTKPFYHALIEIDSAFDKAESKTEITDEEMKFFYIKQFISFAVNRFI